jgi:prevent-host-death family protein
MIKTNTSQFKAKLGLYMKAVRQGEEIIVTDRDNPIAKLVPYGRQAKVKGLTVLMPSPTSPKVKDVVIKGIGRRKTNSLKMLLEDRARR